ncbi:transporter substrate-binding domain-containing protein [Devosia sp. MC1541]|uniref:substrate-binding periplasmic protein n=1 Tax=Devosia sp. MC1541 TaxID=2725264 RepID=UPI00145CDA33|nr:transporter substrate-binding domain-containing protein [Devosia sp. MC1541]
MTKTKLASHLASAVSKLPRIAALLFVCCAPVAAQPEPEFFDRPYVYGQWEIGRKTDESKLRYCVDPRDGEWQVAAAIGEAIANALLLEPVEIVVESDFETEDITRVYRHLLEQCSLYMGFKLLPEGYDPWSMPTRGFYDAKYAFVTDDPNIKSLQDLAPKQIIGAALGTTGHVRLANYNNAQTSERRWRIFPIGTNPLALDAVLSGSVDVALVWEPSLWALQQADDKYKALSVLSSAPLPETSLPVGALMLSNETFLRNSIDEAVATLVSDGTIDAILAEFKFPGQGSR